MKPISKPFPYTSAADSAKPGYLRRKFAEIRKLQREQSAKQSNVSVISVARKGGKT